MKKRFCIFGEKKHQNTEGPYWWHQSSILLEIVWEESILVEIFREGSILVETFREGSILVAFGHLG